ncbi:YeeE/YedE family protein [Salinimonas marina]|uniref:YeeE/YedE family protein n=1 Tax=Salinimonas marina TaxID=2785918 RepID=A0A7S9HBT3_9ALTE|nr:YeeE/YedE family protein [Salinimonas marina]QPG04551.1 YeeE/YedE family protein [Salinimonas marina]
MRFILTALLAGFLFGAGLTISMMTDPARVLGFLDIFGAWDPTLAFVMAGALAIYMPIYQFYIKPRGRTVFNEPCQLPETKQVDKPLITGAVLFGVGWGLSGICPGPGLANLSGGQPAIYVFILTMLLGMIGATMYQKK